MDREGEMGQRAKMSDWQDRMIAEAATTGPALAIYEALAILAETEPGDPTTCLYPITMFWPGRRLECSILAESLAAFCQE
jgi:hypothetical protein